MTNTGDSLRGRTAVVTGAARGIGLACAQRLRADGLRVIGVDVLAGEFGQATAGLDEAAVLDVTDPAAVADFIAARQPVDVLVNSAGVVGPNVPLWEIDDAGWSATFDVNTSGTFHTMRAAIPPMRDRGYGRIVNIASIAGKEGNPMLAAYSASKAAVIGLTKSVAKELATDGVIVNSVAPAVIATPINADTAPSVLEYMISKIPMGRVGQAEEVAALVSWLASDECTFSTGACYDISGGRATY